MNRKAEIFYTHKSYYIDAIEDFGEIIYTLEIRHTEIDFIRLN